MAEITHPTMPNSRTALKKLLYFFVLNNVAFETPCMGLPNRRVCWTTPIIPVTALCSEGSMFRKFYVPKIFVQKVLCSEGSIFRRSYVQKVLCSEGPMFRRSYVQKIFVQKVLYSEGSMFRRSYIQIYSEGPIFRKFFV